MLHKLAAHKQPVRV